jgi:hypothetical protein
MIRSANARLLLKLLIALTFTGVYASAIAAAPADSVAAQDASARSTGSSGTVAYLRQLMDSHQLTQLRTTSNGNYGASLQFQAAKLSYFVVLTHGDTYWRVIQADSERDAESVYRVFAQQTEKLAEVDIDAIRLDAGNKYAANMVAMNQQRLANLQQDANRQHEQAQEVVAAQQQAQQQAVSLTNDLRASSSQLDEVTQRIRALEAQQANPELILPPPAAATTPAPTDASAATKPGN